MSPREHRRREVALRLDVEQRPKVEQIQEVLDLCLAAIGLRHTCLRLVGLVLAIGVGEGGDLVALHSKADLLGDGVGDWLSELLELVDESGDAGLGAEDLLLLLVDRLALRDRLLHLRDAVELLAKGSEALVDEAEDGSV